MSRNYCLCILITPLQKHSTCSFQDDRKTLTPDDIRKRSERREEFLAKRRSGSFDSAGQLRRETVSCRGELPLEPLLLLSSPVGTHSVLKDALEKIQSTNSVEKLKAVQEIRQAPSDLTVFIAKVKSINQFNQSINQSIN
jgi:hypothetical protein